ncbi:hypothetical protein E2P81_ATG01430 [Venturia nashicola]|nr:hypothetical protein E2P81_ATG01430 [Venturia nashicola]
MSSQIDDPATEPIKHPEPPHEQYPWPSSPGRQAEEGNNQGNAERDNPVWFSSRHSRFKIFKHWGVEAHEKAKYIGRRVSGAEKALREVVQREERDLIPSSIHHANPQIDPNAHEIPFVGLIQEELGSRRPMQVGPSMRQDDGRPIGVALSVGEVEIPEQDLGGDTLVFESERYIEWVFDSFAAEVVAPRFGWGD